MVVFVAKRSCAAILPVVWEMLFFPLETRVWRIAGRSCLSEGDCGQSLDFSKKFLYVF